MPVPSACSGSALGRPLRLAALLLCLCAGQPAAAQQPAAPPVPVATAPWDRLGEVVFQTLDRRDGLPHGTVTAITQGAAGFLWVGTRDGLVRYDGYGFRPVMGEEGAGPTGTNILALLPWPDGRLWVGTHAGGLSLYDPATDRFTASRGALTNSTVRALAPDGQTAVWAGSDRGLFRVVPGSLDGSRPMEVEQAAVGLPDAAIFSLLSAPGGDLWIGTGSGLWRLPAGGGRALPVQGPGIPPQLGQTRIYALYQDADGTLWVGSEQGLFALAHGPDGTPGRVRHWREAPGDPGDLGSDWVVAVLEVEPGRIWAATRGAGIAEVDAASGLVRQIRAQAGGDTALPGDSVLSLHRDRSGLVWVGLLGPGLARHNPTNRAIAVLQQGNDGIGITSADVTAVLPLPDGRAVLGSDNQGIELIDPRTGLVSSHRPFGLVDPESGGLPFGSVNSLALAGPNQVWFAAANRVGRLDLSNGAVQPLDLPPLRADGVYAIRLDGPRLLIGTGSGLVVHDTRDGSQRVFSADPADPHSLSDNDVQAMLVMPDGTYWLGTDGGLNHLDPASGRVVRHIHDPDNPASLPHNDVTTLMLDRGGRLWVGTFGGGIAVLDDPTVPSGQWRRLSRKDGLPHTNISMLLQDGQGRIWASTADGLAVIDAPADQPEGWTIRALGRAEGLTLRTFWTDSGAVTADGSLLFGGVGGLAVVRPDRLTYWTWLPPVVISEAMVGNQTLPVGLPEKLTLTLDPPQRGFSLTFAALDFSAPERSRYAWRLDGYEEEWTESAADRRTVTYTNLSPGTYRLLVKASNRDGLFPFRPLVIPVQVRPAWYQTFWFEAALLLLVAGAAFLAYRTRMNMVQSRQHALELQVALRTVELKQQQDALLAANEDLTNAADTLRRLGDVGRDITGTLDAERIYAALHRHVRDLMPAEVFGIALLTPDGRHVDYVYYAEMEERSPPVRYPVNHPTVVAARALREGVELLQLSAADVDAAPVYPGVTAPKPVRSAALRQIQLGGRTLGVINVQSHKPDAYGPRELEALRSIAAYAAIAIANAGTFKEVETARAETAAALAELRSTQAKLVQQEKLASLGQLVAGVAHEINTPLGVAVTVSSYLAEDLQRIAGAFRAKTLRREQMEEFLANGAEGYGILTSNLARAAQLVSSFKQVAADQVGEGRRTIQLTGYLRDVLRSLEPMLRKAGVTAELDGPADLMMTTLPGALAQVVTNLVQNAAVHAFAPQPGPADGPRIQITVVCDNPRRVTLTVADNGAGMPDEVKARAFDPFFTTRRDAGGTGLGLHIVHNIVTGPLQGEIVLASTSGQGTRFTLHLPLNAPAQGADAAVMAAAPA